MSPKQTSLEVIAPSVEEAIARGAAELGLPREALQVEVLDEGAKGFLGLSGRQARVRLSVIGTGEAEPALPEPEAGPEPRPEADRPAEVDPRAALATRETVEELIRLLGLQARVQANWGPADPKSGVQPLLVDVRGDDLGILIGRRGETLAALQYITRLIVAREFQQQVAVVIDIEGYRSRREQQLQRLALRMANQAVELARTLELEPMPANERRIIHLALRDHPAVRTESVGEGAGRKVTIIPKS